MISEFRTYNDLKSFIQQTYDLYIQNNQMKPLKYQNDYIETCISEFIYRTYNPVLDNNFKQELVEKYPKFKQFGKFISEQTTILVNLDVGLGKTITGLVISDLVIQINNLYFNKVKIEIENLIKELSSSYPIYFKKLIELVNLKLQENSNVLNQYKFNVSIVARKNLCLEFEQYKKSKDINWKSYASGFNINTVPSSSYSINSKFLNIIELYNEIQKEILSSDKFFYNSPCINNVYLVDEIDTTLSHAWITHDKVFEKNSIIIGLSANKCVDPYNKLLFRSKPTNVTYMTTGGRVLKTQPEILKELSDSHLYTPENKFLYNFQRVVSDEVIDLTNQLEETKQHVENSILSTLGTIKDYRSNLYSYFRKFTDNQLFTEQELEDFSTKLTLYKQNNDLDKQLQQNKKLFDNVTNLTQELDKTIKDSCYDNIINVLTEGHINYLFEGNTVLILDNSLNSKIKLIKDYLKDNDCKILNTENFRNMSWTRNVLVWLSREVQKWLNLQQFDNIIFMYVNNMSVNDIYQGIGRVDRIWTKLTDKNITMFYYGVQEEFLKQLVSSKDNFNPSMQVSVVNRMSSVRINNTKTFTQAQQQSELLKDNLKNLDTQLAWKLKDLKEKKQLTKEKLLMVNEYKSTFVEIFKEIESQFKQNSELFNNLIGSNYNDLNINNDEYLNTCLEILDA